MRLEIGQTKDLNVQYQNYLKLYSYLFQLNMSKNIYGCAILNSIKQVEFSFIPKKINIKLPFTICLNEKINFEQELNNLTQLLTQHQQQNQTSNAIQKITSSIGAWYCNFQLSFIIILLTNSNYPIFGIMHSFKKITTAINNNLSEQQLYIALRQILMTQDENPLADNILDITAKSVDSVQGKMEENLKQLHLNKQHLEVIHHKSEDITKGAMQFEQAARRVGNQREWYEYLIFAGFFVTILGVSIYILTRIY